MLTSIKKLVTRALDYIIQHILLRGASIQYPNAASQLQLYLKYRSLHESGNALPELNRVGFKVFSQADEDGILLFIFSIIGTTSKKSVEICAGDGIECNTANLIINHGWYGLLVDGDEALVKRGVDFYKKNPQTYIYPPKLIHSWITRDNINDIIGNNGFQGEIDLLSVDMDGVDFWIWNAIHAIDPRVVVVEYQDIIGPEKALTVPYSDSFDAYAHPTTQGMPNFCGASLSAFVKLAESRGYRLVGCNRYGYNAFFIKNTLGEKEIPKIDIKECFTHPKVIWGMKERFPTVKDFPWVEV